MGQINNREERKRYYQDGDKWFCETTIFCTDTQTVDRGWVKEVTMDEVPPSARPPLPPPSLSGLQYDHNGT